jgi:pimeloyl-ACP methyl ester carboxylesterase
METSSPSRPSVGARFPEGWRARVPPEWLEDWSPRPFDLGDGTTEVVTMGEGPTLLLLPPLPGFKEGFLALARRLARRHRVVTFDLRARFPGTPTWEALVTDLERVADTFAPGPSIVLGHSLGAALAMRWAALRPERVSALVLSSPFARTRAPGVHSWKRWVEQPVVLASLRWLPEGWARRLSTGYARRGAWVFDAACHQAVLDLVCHGIRRMPVGDAWQCVQLAFEHDERASLARITAPTLLVVGERETAWAKAAEAEVARLLPRAERVVSPRAAHLHPLSAPEFLAERTLAWLARLEA